jgi:membrane protease YdiL (CAAX protease family)
MTPRARAFARFLLGAAVALAALLIAGLLSPGTPSLLRFDLVYRPLLMLFLLIGFSVLLVAVDHVQENPLASLGLDLHHCWLQKAGFGLLLGAGMVGAAVGVIAVFGAYRSVIHLTQHSAMRAVVAVFVLATGAMAEELIFRGYPFQRLVDAIGGVSAVLVFSALFGIVHLLNPHASVWGFLDTMLVGVLLSLAYLRTRSLWMPWGVHFGWNTTLGLLFGLPVSGLNEFSVLGLSQAAGPVWLTGGSYGLEASATAAGVIIIGIFLLILFVPPHAPNGAIGRCADHGPSLTASADCNSSGTAGP